ncbi:MAG: hypothetical protein J1F22_09490 [Lachnospiraceae bacterium]|nr:hypothetical protein [Lachnospiraceae bacterium]
MTKEEEIEEQHAESDQVSEQRETLRQKKKIARARWGICILMLFFFVAIKFTSYRRDVEIYSPEKLEAFLEYTFEQDCKVEFDKFSYFLSPGESTYLSYIVDVTLKDGTKTYFSAEWKRNSSVDDGVYTDYGERLVSHYADKYGITYTHQKHWSELMLTESNLTDTPSALEQFMEALYDSDYIQAGQEISLQIKAEGRWISENVDVNIEEPVDVKEIVKKFSR